MAMQPRIGRSPFVFLFGICTLETVLAWIWLARIPGDPKNAVLWSLSVSRLLTLSVLSVATISFFVLLLLSWRSQGFDSWNSRLTQSSKLAIVLFNVLAIGALASLFLLFIAPPSLIPPHSALSERLAPVLIWVALICSQGLLFVNRFFHVRPRAWASRLASYINRWIANPLSGYILLALSVLVASTQVFYVHYNMGDEGDTFSVGWLMAGGWRLYSDIFSHHFPLSYAWVALVVKAFGTSVFAVRFSLILLRTVIFAFAMRLSGYTFALGLTALAWSAIGHLYLGNALLYPSFSGMFAVAAFSIAMAAINKDRHVRNIDFVAVGILLGLAVLTDPLKILPAAVVVFVLFFSAWSKDSILMGSRSGAARSGMVGLGIVLCLAVFLAWLIGADSLYDFFQNAILFNLQVYSKYTGPIKIDEVIQPIANLLDLFDAQWLRQLSPFYEWGSFESIDTWIFTGLFYRLAIVVASATLVIRGKLLSGLFLYLFASTMVIRSSIYFHASPFVLFSIFVSSLLLSGELSNKGSLWSQVRTSNILRFPRKILGVLQPLARLIVLLMFAWLSIRGVAFLVGSRTRMTYSEGFGGLEGNAAYLKRATCFRQEARILVYPLDPFMYFLSEIPPASKYHFLTPWVAEIGEGEAISDLRERPVLVRIDRDQSIWGNPVEQYLGEFLDYLDKNYIPIGSNYYISPELLRICPEDSGT